MIAYHGVAVTPVVNIFTCCISGENAEQEDGASASDNNESTPDDGKIIFEI